jgi:enoyl-CoA hydratase/carnithine racemase
MGSIEATRDGSTLVLTIANEAKRNALSHDMSLELARQLRSADSDPAIKCIVLTGKGGTAFCSGHDLKELLADREHASDPSLNEPFVLPALIETPTIAAINGYAHAGGFILALSCDLRVCAANASFAAPGARIGLLPIGGQLARLPTLLPHGVAHELLITCREMLADEAVRHGFANHLVPAGDALEASLRIAAQIARNSQTVIRAIKRGLSTLSAQGAAAATEFEWTVARELQAGPDAAEGIRAFLEKRSPQFGRAR